MSESISMFATPVVIGAIVLAIVSLIMFVSRNYLKCAPNAVLVLYGRKNKYVDQGETIVKGFRVIAGGAAFRIPLLEQAQFMSLELMQVDVGSTNAPNKDGVLVNVEAIANVKVSSDSLKLTSAVERFLGKSEDEIKEIVQNILEGNLRQIVGTLTIEDIVRDREKMAQSVLDATQAELDRIGIVCDNFVIRNISDKEGYIDSLGKAKTAQVIRDATIGKAEADREAAVKSSVARREAEEARLQNEALISASSRDLEVKRAKYQQEIAAEQARAALAGEIARTEREKELVQNRANVKRTEVEAMTQVSDKEAALKEKDLITNVIRPAEAERNAASIRAEGKKQADLIAADGERQSAIIRADGQAKAKVEIARAEADATRATAEAERVRITAEGEGAAAAEAAKKRLEGLAEAEVVKAKLLAEADGVQRRGEAEGAAIKARGAAEGAAIQAKLLAEADGIRAKNEALERMSEGARYILVLEKLPGILDHGGDALSKALTPACQAIGQGLAGIDKVQILDMGSNGKNGGAGGIEQFALTVPRSLLQCAETAKAGGFDPARRLSKIGMQAAPGDGVAPRPEISAADTPGTN